MSHSISLPQRQGCVIPSGLGCSSLSLDICKDAILSGNELNRLMTRKDLTAEKLSPRESRLKQDGLLIPPFEKIIHFVYFIGILQKIQDGEIEAFGVSYGVCPREHRR